MTIISECPPAVTTPTGVLRTLHLDNFRPMELCFAIMLALATNRWRRRAFCPGRLAEVMRQLRYDLSTDPIVNEVADRFGTNVNRHQVLARLQISFWAHVLDVADRGVCHWPDDSRLACLTHALGLRQACHPQRIAELHTRLGPALRQRFYARCKELICQRLNLATLSEDDLSRAVEAQTFDPLFLEMSQAYGFSYFLNFIFWQGIFARLEAALIKPLAPNGYTVRELVAAYFRRFDTQAATLDALADELANQLWAPASDQTVAPVSQTWRNFLMNLDPDQVILVHEELVRRRLTHKLKVKGRHARLAVAIDACLLPLFGDFEQAEMLYDHVTKQYIHGYKLYVAFEVETRQPLAFVLHEPEAQRADESPKGDADYLQELVDKVKDWLRVDHLAYVVFDKGFWSQTEFACLDQAGERWVTPGKQFKTVREAIAAIPRRQWVRAAYNQRVAETHVTFENGLRLRLVVWKCLGRKVVRNRAGKSQRGPDGKTRYEPAPIYYSYVTNIPADEMDGGEVIGLYGQRWGVEDYFEQMVNQYALTHFPKTTVKLVKLHLALTWLGYTLLSEFQRLVAVWSGHAEYVTMELRRFARVFLRVPVARLLWLKNRRPREHAKRRSRHRNFISSLASFGQLESTPELL